MPESSRAAVDESRPGSRLPLDVGQGPSEGETPDEPADAPSDAGQRAVVVRIASPSRLQSGVLLLLGVLLALFVVALGKLLQRMSSNERQQTVHLERFEREIQRLDAGLSFDSRRRRLLLSMRDEIMRANPTIGLHDAFRYAEYILEASVKYPAIPPLMLLAVGEAESGFRADAVSSKDARGLYQIWPSTGRLLARALGWEYSDELLLDPARNTEMAALYLDILYATYNDPSLVLAEYNGGPRNAGRFRAGASDVAVETRDYVPKVLALYDRLRAALDVGDPLAGASVSMYRDPNRNGKTLADAVARAERFGAGE
jgi:peptidoglycan lytic transglycosylase